VLALETLSSVPQQDMDMQFSVFTTSDVWGGISFCLGM